MSNRRTSDQAAHGRLSHVKNKAKMGESSKILTNIRPKKFNVTVAIAATFFSDFGATTFFYFYQNSGNPLGNSRKFSGIPRNSREFPNFQKKLNVATTIFLFFA